MAPRADRDREFVRVVQCSACACVSGETRGGGGGGARICVAHALTPLSVCGVVHAHVCMHQQLAAMMPPANGRPADEHELRMQIKHHKVFCLLVI